MRNQQHSLGRYRLEFSLQSGWLSEVVEENLSIPDNYDTEDKTIGKNQPTVSHHLSLMRKVNFVTTRIDGKTHYYRIVPEQIEKVIAHIFKTNVGHAGYLQFPKFQVEYHPRDKGILPTEASDEPTDPNTSLRDTI